MTLQWEYQRERKRFLVGYASSSSPDSAALAVQEFDHWLIMRSDNQAIEIPCERFEVAEDYVAARILLDPRLYSEDLNDYRVLIIGGVRASSSYLQLGQYNGLQVFDIQLPIEQFPALCPQTWFAIVPESNLLEARFHSERLGGGELEYINRCEFLSFYGSLFARSSDNSSYYKIAARLTAYECGRLRVKIRDHNLTVRTSPSSGHAEVSTREGFRLPWLSWGNDEMEFKPWTNLEYWMDFITEVVGFGLHLPGDLHPIEGQAMPTAFHVFEFKITPPERSQYEATRRIWQLEAQLQRKYSIESKCQGCQNYHGETYGGNRLVCGIHPKGYDKGETCPDFAQ